MPAATKVETLAEAVEALVARGFRWLDRRGCCGTDTGMVLIPYQVLESIGWEVRMVSVHDVAAFILKEYGKPMTAMKLQKLVYYSQAWSLVWDERPLFPEPIQAWANGPVAPALYAIHRGMFDVGSWPSGDPSKLDEPARDTVRAVLKYYGQRPAQWLSDLTHGERPWMNARKGLDPGERGDVEITPAAMAEYYGSIPPDL
jgi:uncharacterized phage-associated protein